MVRERMQSSRFANITKIMNTKLELREVLQHVTAAISEEILQCNVVGIYLPQEDGTYRGFAGKPDCIEGITIDSLIVDPERDLLAKELIDTKKTIYIADTSEDHRPAPEPIKAFSIKSLLALPITFEDELFGLVFLFNDGTSMHLTESEIQSVEDYVNMAALAIRNASILKQKESLIAEKQLILGATHELCKCTSIEDSLNTCFSYMGKILNTRQIAAYLVNPFDRQTIRPLRAYHDNKWMEADNRAEMEESFQHLFYKAIKTKEIIIIEDLHSDERVSGHCHMESLLLIPFVSMGEAVGVIAAFNIHSKSRIQLAQSIVDATALTFSNVQYVDRLESMVEERTKELAAANEKVTSVIEGITDGFFALDKEWNFTYVNKHLFFPKNKTVKEVLGKNIWRLFPKTIDTAMYTQLHRAMIERIPVHFEMRSVYEDYWYEIVAYPYDEGICCLFKNITEKKKYEKELKRLSSLDLIGQMAAGISHEIRNPMTTVRGFLQLLKLEGEYSQHHHYFDLMIEELDRANAIITEFLSMGNTKTSDLEMLDLNIIIHDMIPLMKIDAASQSKMIAVDTGDIPKLLLNRNEIRQLLMNLYRNGFEAMSEGQVLTVKTYKEGDDVVLAVQDQGKGISPEVMEKLGTPFFTTKDNGTGLGLGVCYAIAARHNAKIDIKTGDKGTTFLIRFNLRK